MRRGLAHNASYAAAGDALSKAAIFAALAGAGHLMPVPQFAALSVALAAATVATAFLDTGCQTLITRDAAANPGSARALALRLTAERWPLVLAAVAAAAYAAQRTGSGALVVSTLMLSVACAAVLTLSGMVRATADLRPEARAKTRTAILTVTLGGGGALAGSATLVVLGMLIATVAGVGPLVKALPRGGARPMRAVRLTTAVPLGIIAMATLVYYRSGTLVLGWLGETRATGEFAAASTIAFGLLLLPNAVTSALLPALSAASPRERRALVRRALVYALSVAAGTAAVVAVGARPLLAVAFGPRYEGAATALVLLSLATVPIAGATVLGTALIAGGRLRPVGLQVGLSLGVNLLALALLARPYGAAGAAAATLACESVGLTVLVLGSRQAPVQMSPLGASSPR